MSTSPDPDEGRPEGGPFDVDVLLWEHKRDQKRIRSLLTALERIKHEASECLFCPELSERVRTRVQRITATAIRPL